MKMTTLEIPPELKRLYKVITVSDEGSIFIGLANESVLTVIEGENKLNLLQTASPIFMGRQLMLRCSPYVPGLNIKAPR